MHLKCKIASILKGIVGIRQNQLYARSRTARRDSLTSDSNEALIFPSFRITRCLSIMRNWKATTRLSLPRPPSPAGSNVNPSSDCLRCLASVTGHTIIPRKTSLSSFGETTRHGRDLQRCSLTMVGSRLIKRISPRLISVILPTICFGCAPVITDAVDYVSILDCSVSQSMQSHSSMFISKECFQSLSAKFSETDTLAGSDSFHFGSSFPRDWNIHSTDDRCCFCWTHYHHPYYVMYYDINIANYLCDCKRGKSMLQQIESRITKNRHKRSHLSLDD